MTADIKAILDRHSVRSYLPKKIEAETAAKLNELIAACNAEADLHLQLLTDAGNTFSRFLNKVMGLGSAPAVIACVGTDNETLDERVGYYGEKIVLFAQQLGLNTCWAGTYSPEGCPAEIAEGERLAIVIAIGYGTAPGRQHRSKLPEQVIVGKPAQMPAWFMKGVKAALLAPTAVNQQKFRIALKEDGTVEFTDMGGVLSKIDLGIVKYHFEIGSTQWN